LLLEQGFNLHLLDAGVFLSDSKLPSLFPKSMESTKYKLTTGNSTLITNTFPMPDPACSACSEPIYDPAERWPAATTGTVCQMCWEAQSSRLWWAMVRLLPEERAHA